MDTEKTVTTEEVVEQPVAEEAAVEAPAENAAPRAERKPAPRAKIGRAHV